VVRRAHQWWFAVAFCSHRDYPRTHFLLMADQADAFSTLDDFLLSLADGIASAQDALTRAGSVGPPGRQYAYHLPRVEFELRLNLRVVEDQLLSDRYRLLRAERTGDKHLLFKPISADAAASTLDIAAVVRGAFVAVPANDGLPATVLRTAVDTVTPRAPIVRVTATNTAGEPLAGIEVHFNVDREESAALTQAAGSTLALAADTGFAEGVVTTDASGVARSALQIGAAQQPCILELVIDAAGRTETLIYEVTA
jgi:hypothetical protein